MRYYDIKILEPDTREVIREYSSLMPNGWTNPRALHVELDIPTFALAEPAGTAFVRIWGISIQDVNQAFNLRDKVIQVYGGMSKGLPLANPDQRGLLLEADITQPFGNWQGPYMSLDLICQSAIGSQNAPANIVLNWLAGQPLSTALTNTLAAAFPSHTVAINISPNLVQDHDEPGAFQTVIQLAQWVKAKTQAMIGGLYTGVDMLVREKQFVVYDGTSPTAPRAIAFKDLIGQPTWIGPETIQFKCPMRADINGNDYVTLPEGQVTITGQSMSQYRDKTTFTGAYHITQTRAVGAYRQPDADAWVSVFDATPDLKEVAASG